MRVKQLLVLGWMIAMPGLALAEPQRPGAVPEPETLALLCVGAIALFIARRRDKK